MRSLICLSLVFCLAGAFSASVAAAEPAAGEIDLLSPPPGAGNPNWLWLCGAPNVSIDKVWKTEGGVLICKGTPKGYIYTAKDYTNFVLRLEWRWPPGKKAGNGGVLLRMTGKHRVWPKSLEAQLNAGQAGDFWGLDGFPLQGPADRMKSFDSAQFGKLTNLRKAKGLEKTPGEWNQYEIIARGETVTLKVNGKLVNKATGCAVAAGKICLTAEGDEYHFRKVKLTPLDN